MKIYYSGTSEELSLALEEQGKEVAVVLKDPEGKIRSLVGVFTSAGTFVRMKINKALSVEKLPLRLNSEGRVFVQL